MPKVLISDALSPAAVAALHSRGVEFAVVNNDVLAYLDLVKKHPDARPKIRYVTKLFSQKVYLLVRGDIGALDQLNGTDAAAVSLMTGLSAEELDDLGGLPK